MVNIVLAHCSFSGLQSYKRSSEAWAKGLIKDEIVEVRIPGKRGKPDIVVSEDEEYKKVNFEKFKKLATVFQVGYFYLQIMAWLITK